MAVNTLLHFFLTLLTSSLFQDVLPQCSLVVKIRFTTCQVGNWKVTSQGQYAETLQGHPIAPLEFPNGFLWGVLRKFWYIDWSFLVTPGSGQLSEGTLFLPPSFRSDLKITRRGLFCVCHGGWSLEETLALWAATFLSNTHGEALGSLLMCSNCLHVTLITPNLGTSEVLDFPYFTPQNPESDNLSPA